MCINGFDSTKLYIAWRNSGYFVSVAIPTQTFLERSVLLLKVLDSAFQLYVHFAYQIE
jgi:hypothetical protein